MNSLRDAAQAALEAMDSILLTCSLALGNDGIRVEQYMKGVTASRALRAALAEPVEPVEPVAWVRLEAWKSGKDWPDDCFTALPAEGLTPVYTAPPQRKPLSADKTMALANETAGANWGDEAHLQRFRAAIERAHGIPMPDEP